MKVVIKQSGEDLVIETIEHRHEFLVDSADGIGAADVAQILIECGVEVELTCTSS